MKKGLIVLASALLLMGACKREQPFSRFNTNLLVPLAKTELDLGNLLSDSVLVPDPNGALRLVTSYDLYRARIADIFVFPDTERVNTLSLKTLKLADQTQSQIVPLFLIFPGAAALHGQTVPIPAQSISGITPIQIDASAFFKQATFNSGTMEIKIDNGYPVEISKLIFQLSNQGGSVIQTDTFTNIAPGSSQTKIIDLAGKTLTSDLLATPILIETAPSNGAVLINQYAITTITFSVKDLKPQSAVARFPAQSVITSDETVVYDLGEAQIKNATFAAGTARFRVVSTIEEEMNVNYYIPYATKNATPFHVNFKVPAAPPGGVANFLVEYDLAGYKMDLRGKDPWLKDTVNSMYNILDVTIDSTGIERNISMDDSVFIYLGLIDIIPEYAEGYFGNETIEVGPETVDFDFFAGLKGGIDFEDINVNLVLESGVGSEARATINQLTSRNTKKGTTVQLTGAGVNGPHTLASATYPPLVKSRTAINLNKNNSNIKPFIEQLPDKLDYHLSIVTSPNGNVNNYKDFVVKESEIVAKLEVDMPVSLKADNITLSDTLNFDFSTVANNDRILEGKLNIVADNGFPFEVDLQVFVVDEYGQVVDSLMGTSNNRVMAAQADANGYIATPLRSVAIAYASPEKMARLRHAKKLIVRATINTPKTNANYWKIYSNYTFNVSLTGDFIYDQNY
ncbi:MAG: hypothetical protein LPK45_06370 [Bacteroidota bacterium]|nr:hypothetical protein [Bacteroidota bacterium]MDX5430697.1 hypothetical protein [Bacteroidota bacterium]MDX5469444.1 hypothetical protein [Bacteroidota bacterium]